MQADIHYVLAIGELLVDAISNDFVTDLSQAKTFTVYSGGSPANFCRFLANAGVTARLVAAVGKDGFGARLLQDVKAAGLSTAHIQELNEHATSLIAVGRTKATPDFIPYRDADKHIAPLSDELVKQAALVHTTAFALSQGPAQTIILNAFEKAYSSGIPLSVDWNYSEKIWGSNNNAETVFNRLQGLNALFKFSLDDVERFLGKTLTVEEAKGFLATVNAELVCLTCGADGVWYKTKRQTWTHQPALPVEVKDATGAGDAFWAGFIDRYIQQQPLSNCIANALQMAANRLAGKI